MNGVWNMSTRKRWIWASTWQNQQNECAPSEDQSLRCALIGLLRTQVFFMRTAKILIRLGGWVCAGRTVILLVLSCRGSYAVYNTRITCLVRLYCCKGIISHWRQALIPTRGFAFQVGNKAFLSLGFGPGGISGMNLVHVCHWVSSYPPYKCILDI